MHPRLVLHLATALLALAAPVAVSADVISISASVDGRVSGVPLSDTQGPAASGSLLAARTWGPGQSFSDPTSTASARAAQDDAGRSAVRVDALPSAPQSDFQIAESHWTNTVTHPGPLPAEYVYDFHIDPAVLSLRNTGGATNPNASVSYEVTVKLDGQTVFHSAATLTGTSANPHLVETGTDLGGTFFSGALSKIYGYQFSAFDGLVSLGTHQPGVPFTVEAILRVSSQNNEPGMGARAVIGDPLNLGSDPGTSGKVFITTLIGVQSRSWAGVKDLYRDGAR